MAPINVFMVGTREYTTGFVGGGMSTSDKRVGAVALILFNLRRRGKVGALSMVGTSGTKFPAIREHLAKNISAVYNDLDVSFSSFPSDSTRCDPEAYKAAIDELSPGDAVTIFTPDTTHYPIALYAIQCGMHVLITKPAKKLIKHHQHLLAESRRRGVFVFVEHHKRFDPAYSDAKAKAKTLEAFNYFYSYMSQPKSQLQIFKAWAGQDTHHIDVCASMVPEYRPTRVIANSSQGIAEGLGCVQSTEDTILLLVNWDRRDDPNKRGTAVYTASWTAPQKAGVHSNQYFHYMAEGGEINMDQAKKGYIISSDSAGQVQWFNPFYMHYAPDEEGNFSGTGYGYVSYEKLVDAVTALKEGRVTLDGLDRRGLSTLKNTLATTAILKAGRMSLDEKRPVEITETTGLFQLH